MDALVSGVWNVDLFVTRNPRACAAHSGLYAEPWQNPAVENDPKHKYSDDGECVFHGNGSL